ncbi:hypothetical protein GCM10010377_51260 [Streptomyces viridiviolaceus]|nr:hypothetical protein GCM10010377_51260 [Streptomyces viridiviolaceus]
MFRVPEDALLAGRQNAGEGHSMQAQQAHLPQRAYGPYDCGPAGNFPQGRTGPKGLLTQTLERARCYGLRGSPGLTGEPSTNFSQLDQVGGQLLWSLSPQPRWINIFRHPRGRAGNLTWRHAAGRASGPDHPRPARARPAAACPGVSHRALGTRATRHDTGRAPASPARRARRPAARRGASAGRAPACAHASACLRAQSGGAARCAVRPTGTHHGVTGPGHSPPQTANLSELAADSACLLLF